MSYPGIATSRGFVQPIAPRCGLASGGTSWLPGYAGILTRSVHAMPASVGGATDIQLVAGNFSPAAYPEANIHALSTSACLEYGGNVYWFTWGRATAGLQPHSVLIPGGARVTSDPIPCYIAVGSSYAIRKLDRADPPVCTATISGGAVTGITVASQGVGGWTQPPTVTLSGGGFTTAATAVAVINAAGQITGFTISGGGGYTSAPTVTVSTQIPVGRNSNPELGEFMAYYTAGMSVPNTPFGAELTTGAATAAGGTTLTFGSTSVAAFNGAAIAAGAVLNVPGLVPGTKVTAVTSTTLTFSPASIGVVPAGANVRVLANRPLNSNAGHGPLAVLGRVKQRSAAALIFGDSIAAGKYVQGSLTTSAASASGSSVLTFGSTTLAGVIMAPGLELPATSGLNAGLQPGTVIAAVSATTVTLSLPLTAAVASGTSITFGRQSDGLGHIGFIEKGLVTGYGTGAAAPAVPFTNMALSGDTFRNFWDLGNGACRMSFLGEGWTHAFDEYGINDFANSSYATLAAYQASKLAFWALLGSYGIKVIVCTTLPETNSTDGWMTAANQTPKNIQFQTWDGSAADPAGLEVKGNTWLRGLVSAGTVWDVVDASDAVCTGRNTQAWGTVTLSNGGTATAYPMTLDGVHPVGPGQGPLAAAVAARVAAGMLA